MLQGVEVLVVLQSDGVATERGVGLLIGNDNVIAIWTHPLSALRRVLVYESDILPVIDTVLRLSQVKVKVRDRCVQGVIEAIVVVWIVLMLEYTDAVESTVGLLLLGFELALSFLASSWYVTKLVNDHLLILG